MLKDLVKNLKPSSTLLINETSKKLEDQGKRIFKFGFGQSPFKVPEDIVKELKNNAHQNKYLPIQGLLELRDTVAKYTSTKKNYNYKSENVIIGPGSKELMFLLHVIFDGEIILPAPSWVSYAPQAILGRNKVQILQTKRENNWFPTASEIEEIVLKDKNKLNLNFALKDGIIDRLGKINEIIKANIVILSVDVESAIDLLPKILTLINNNCLVIDFGSTKGKLCSLVSDHPKRNQFLATHPIAGTEFSGPEAAHLDLFRNKDNVFILRTFSKMFGLASLRVGWGYGSKK